MRHFAEIFSKNHNNTVKGAVTLIDASVTKYKFIKRRILRRLFENKYEEIRDLYFSSPASSFYGALFTTGSLLETMLDDLFTRNNSLLWADYQTYFSRSGNYPQGSYLSNKIDILRRMCVEKEYPLPKDIILWMVMILEYRNLIHPNKEYSRSIYQPNQYVCAMLFSAIANIAHYWWPKNQLESK